MDKHRLILSLKYLLLVGVILTIIKMFIIWWEYWTPWQCSKQITSLSFHLSVQVYYLLGQTEGERKNCFREWYKGGHIVRLPPIGRVCHKSWKSLFLKFEIILPLSCFLLGLYINKHCRTWNSMIGLRIDSRTCQK